MSDDAIRHKAQQVLYDWKQKLDVTRNISMEDELVSLIEEALRTEEQKGEK